MVAFLAGEKGTGKTRRMIEMANENAKVADGNLVFVDDDRRHIFDLKREIRFVEAGRGDLYNCGEFVGYIRGILSQNSDIQHIYADGLNNILQTVDNDGLVDLAKRLDVLAKENHLSFTLSVNIDKNAVPAELKDMLI